MSNTNQKIETLNKLRTAEAIYVLMSSCTRMPYVVCDPETFDDEILLYYTEAEAKEEAMKCQKEGQNHPSFIIVYSLLIVNLFLVLFSLFCDFAAFFVDTVCRDHFTHRGKRIDIAVRSDYGSRI